MKNLNHESIEAAVTDEKASSSKLSRHKRQERRFELSDPSTVSKRLCAIIAERFPPQVICDKLQDLMEATTTNRNGDTVPDHRAQESAAKILLAYSVGLPVQRSETVEVHISASAQDVQAQLAQSPALRSQLKRMLDSSNEPCAS